MKSVLKTAALKSQPVKNAAVKNPALKTIRPVPDAMRMAIIEESDAGGERPLWRAHTLAMAADGTVHGDFAANHVAFTPGEVQRGSLYIAQGEVDAMAALQNGAAGCLSVHRLRGPHVLVDDIHLALARIARASRNRSRATMTALAGFAADSIIDTVLHDALDRASRGMAWSADAELGMAASLCTLAADRNHAIFTLDNADDARALRPHLFVSGPTLDHKVGESIAATLQAGGAAVLPADSCDFAAWRAAALDAGAQVYGYGRKPSADIRLIDTVTLDDGSVLVTADMMGRAMCWSLAEGLFEEGDALESLAIMGAMRAAGASLGAAALALCGHVEEDEHPLAVAV
jgi:UDP-N-acetylmuramoyl-tripeptide--D-alanyl-D-alanine ligase